jgi:hypothetical protein
LGRISLGGHVSLLGRISLLSPCNLLSPYGLPDPFTFLSPTLLNSLRFLMHPSAGMGLAVLLRLLGSPLG